MSYRHHHFSRPSGSGHIKDVAIPEYVPVGAVIGKGGSYCKSIRETHSVRCSVDGANRKVTLTGAQSNVVNAENELAALFASFAIAEHEPPRVFEVVARNGPSHWWAFKEVERVTSDALVAEYRYRLVKSGQATKNVGLSESWIQNFSGSDHRSVMVYLRERELTSSPKFKIAFGSLCFKLKSIRCYDSDIVWSELQKLRNLEDFSSRWSNVCDRTSPSIAYLLDDLEDWMEEGVAARNCLSVHIGEKTGKSWDLKYHLVGDKWELQSAYTRRVVRGTYDVVLDNEMSFRLRAVTRERLADNAADDIQRHVAISTSDESNFFATSVSMSDAAPGGMFIKSFEVKSKVHVDHRGLLFSICYLNQSHSEFRLECRLSKAEKESLAADGNPCQLLLENVLGLVSRGVP